LKSKKGPGTLGPFENLTYKPFDSYLLGPEISPISSNYRPASGLTQIIQYSACCTLQALRGCLFPALLHAKREKSRPLQKAA
jgi:hypothetical protein